MPGSRFNPFRLLDSLRFVVGMVLVLVLAPTIGLVWLLLSAVENEHAAIQQKMLDSCVQNLRALGNSLDAPWREALRLCETGDDLEPPAAFAAFIKHSAAAYGEGAGFSIVLCDEKGYQLYPLAFNQDDGSPDATPALETAWQLEFAERKDREALELYTRLAALDAGTPAGWDAQLGIIRTLHKTGDLEGALRVCAGLASLQHEAKPGLSQPPLFITARAKVLLTRLKQTASDGISVRDLEDLLTTATTYDPGQPECLYPLSAQTRIFLLNEAIDMAGNAVLLSPQIIRRKRMAERLLTAERQVDALTFHGARLPLFQDWPADQVHLVLAPGRSLMALRHVSSLRQVILVRTMEVELGALQRLLQAAAEPGFSCQVTDSSGQIILGSHPAGRTPVFEMPMSRLYSRWKIALIREQEQLGPAARRRIALYTWVGILAAVGILIVLVLTLGALRRHIRLNRMKGDLLSLISHELKTPLASTKAMLDTLREGRYRDASQVQEYLQLASIENDKLCRLVENFLTLTRVERDSLPPRLEPTPPRALVEEALQSMQRRLTECGAAVSVAVEPDLPDLLVNRSGMVTVLTNLLDNACKYGYDGLIRIRIAIRREGAWVCFQVEDNGIGFSRQEARKIFRHFYQADRTLARRGGGCGLGLSIVKSIVDAHRGRIEATSRPGQGSTFIVKLRVP